MTDPVFNDCAKGVSSGQTPTRSRTSQILERFALEAVGYIPSLTDGPKLPSLNAWRRLEKN
jgi:hypothetical protein